MKLIYPAFLLVTGIISFYGFAFIGFNAEYYIYISLIMCILFAFKPEMNRNLYKMKIRPVHVFLISYMIVFYQKALDYILGYDVGAFEIWNEGIMTYCVFLATIGLSTFLLGYNSYKDKYNYTSSSSVIKAPATLFKFFTSFLLIVLLITIPRSVLMGGYNTGYDAGNSSITYIMSWINVFIAASFIQTVLNIKADGICEISIKNFIKEIGLWQNINIIVNILIILNIGDRGPVVVLLLAYYISYVAASNKTPSLKIISIAFVFAAFFFSLLGESKKYRGDDNIFERLSVTLNSQDQISKPETIFEPTNELARSFKCLAISTAFVPSTTDYNYGLYQLNHIITPIPFASRFINLPGNSSKTVTSFVLDENRSYGLGTSCLAEFYLDLGPLGILLGMFLWGYLLRYFENVLAETNNISVTTFSISFFFCINVFTMPRSAIFLYLKYALWLAFIFKLYHGYLIQKDKI